VVRVREADDHEFDQVGQLTVDAYLEVFGHDGLHGYEHELRDVTSRASAGTVLVAVDDEERLVGAVAYVPGPGTQMSEFDDEDAAGIRMLAVDPARQGRGAGRRLVDACVALARGQGKRRVLLHSTDAMAVARALYEQMGFRRAPERDHLVSSEDMGGAEPLLLMAYELVL